MFFDPTIPQWFEINTCTLDQAEAHPPSDECWTEDQLNWIATHPTIPTYHQVSPLPKDP
jgi:hypothetical protein